MAGMAFDKLIEYFRGFISTNSGEISLANFDILLTVHLSIILIINGLNERILVLQ